MAVPFLLDFYLFGMYYSLSSSVHVTHSFSIPVRDKKEKNNGEHSLCNLFQVIKLALFM